MPWELGDGDEPLVEVELRGAAAIPAASGALGEEVAGREGVRRFRIKRPDAFVRWLLSFAGDARPLSPPPIVAEFRRQAEATLALYAGGAT